MPEQQTKHVAYPNDNYSSYPLDQYTDYMAFVQGYGVCPPCLTPSEAERYGRCDSDRG